MGTGREMSGASDVGVPGGIGIGNTQVCTGRGVSRWVQVEEYSVGSRLGSAPVGPR